MTDFRLLSYTSTNEIPTLPCRKPKKGILFRRILPLWAIIEIAPWARFVENKTIKNNSNYHSFSYLPSK